MRAPWLAASVLALYGCGLATHVRPVPPGALQVEVAAGGPMAVVGIPLPLPLGTVGARYGLLPRWDAGMHVHLTSLIALRTPGFNLETNVLALEQSGATPGRLALRPRLRLHRLPLLTSIRLGAGRHRELGALRTLAGLRQPRPAAAVRRRRALVPGGRRPPLARPGRGAGRAALVRRAPVHGRLVRPLGLTLRARRARSGDRRRLRTAQNGAVIRT